jgi:hypothetical protein
MHAILSAPFRASPILTTSLKKIVCLGLKTSTVRTTARTFRVFPNSFEGRERRQGRARLLLTHGVYLQLS